MSAAAARFAAARHRGQLRKDGKTPFIFHPVTVRKILVREGGVGDRAEIEAALLHDTIEDTDTTAAELASSFGLEVASLVMELTNDPNATDKHASQVAKAATLSAGAARVKIADKTANLRDIIARPPTRWSTARKQRYMREAREVVDQLRWASPALSEVFDRTLAVGVLRLGTQK